MLKRRLEALTNEELAQVLGMRSRKLEAWLATENTYHTAAKLLSLPLMECLVELEARAAPTSQQHVSYLAEGCWVGEAV